LLVYLPKIISFSVSSSKKLKNPERWEHLLEEESGSSKTRRHWVVNLRGEVDMLKIGNAGKSDSATSLLNRSPLSCILRAKGKNLIRKKLEQTKIVLYDRTQTYDRINDSR